MKPSHLLCGIAMLLAVVAFAQGAPAAPPAPLKVVCFGDSITGNRPREAYLDKYLKWADLLQLMLEARLGPGKAVVLNRGFAGDKTYPKPSTQTPGAVTRVQADVLDEKPDVAVILIGGNDDKGTPEQKAVTEANLNTIVKGCKDAGIKVLLLQYSVLPHPTKPEKTWYHLAGNNDLIAKVGAAQGAPVLDMNAPMQDAAKIYPHDELANPVDGVHLAPRGEMVYARTVFAKLVELGWAGVVPAV